MSRLQRAGILALLVVAALMAAPGINGAGAKKHKKKAHSWKSKVTLTAPTSTQFTGTVTSSLRACTAARVVNLNYTDPQGDLSPVPLAVDRTTKKGKYSVYLPVAAYPGTYQLILDAQKIRARGGPQRCKGAQSATVKVG